MRKLFFIIAALAVGLTAGLTSCSKEDEPEGGDFDDLTPGLYVTTLNKKLEPKAVDKGLYVSKDGGFFMRGVNILPNGTERDTLWTVDSVSWIQLRDTVLHCPPPADSIRYADNPWIVAERFTPSTWLWIERTIPDANPKVRPMVVKFYHSMVMYPRDIKVYLSCGSYRLTYPIIQFGLTDQYVIIDGRSEPVEDQPTVEMVSVRQPDGSFVISERR